MTDTTQKLAKEVIAHLSTLRNIEIPKDEQAHVIPSDWTPPPEVMEYFKTNPALKLLLTNSNSPKLVSINTVWDTEEPATSSFIAHLKQQALENQVFLQILENIPRYVSLNNTPFLTTLIATGKSPRPPPENGGFTDNSGSFFIS